VPKIDNDDAQALSVNQLRILKRLEKGGALRRSKIEDEVGGASALANLAAIGLVAEHVLDLDGIEERAFAITSEGKKRLKGAALPSLTKRDDEDDESPAISAIAPWFGSARRVATSIGEAMRGCKWVGVPFCGGLSEIPAMLSAGVNAIALNDTHAHLINMARVMADVKLGAVMFRRLRRMPFCEATLRNAQSYCSQFEPDDYPDVDAAVFYFVCAWMARSSDIGKKKEFNSGLAIRYAAGGGNSVLRYFNAVGGLKAWQKILSRCSLSCDDAFEFIPRCNDRKDGGIYCDPPWPDVGHAYKQRFSDKDWEHLSNQLEVFNQSRIVVRTCKCELTERLFRKDKWRWLEMLGRTQHNDNKTEYLLTRNG
jgi:site-specific DNA-adenine methylase